MNPSLRIDFAPRRPRLPLVGVAAFLVAAIICAGIFLNYLSVAGEVEELASREQAARHQLERLKGRRGGSGQADLGPAAIAAVNRAVIQMNMPWQDLFEIFEAKALPTVALLGLEPDSRKQLLRVTAEAKGADDMADFLQMLLADPRVAEARLVRHEINERDGNRPIRFVLEVRWRAEE